MKTNGLNAPSFKGNYLVKGQPEVLDEICWYLQRKQKSEELPFRFIDIRNALILPMNKITKGENVDLFITQKDRELVEPKMINMVEDSVAAKYRTMPIAQKVRVLLENLDMMRENISHGKPVSNINSGIFENYFKFFEMKEKPIISAEEAFSGIRKGTFDIIEGKNI